MIFGTLLLGAYQLVLESDTPIKVVQQQQPSGSSTTITPSTQGSDSAQPSTPTIAILAQKRQARSVIIAVAPVNGAKDYRITTRDKLDTYCAGLKQYNLPAAPDEPLTVIQVDDVAKGDTLTIEAIDQLCPFPGIVGSQHSIQTVPQGTGMNDAVPFIVYTPSEIISSFTTWIHNGHGPGNVLGAQAPNIKPNVLARTTITITSDPVPTTGDIVMDMSQNDSVLRETLLADDGGRSQKGALYSDKNFNFYTYGNQDTELFKAGNTLHTVIADWSQDIFGHVYWVPKRPAKITPTGYTKVVWDTASDSSGRRYWWFFACGAETLGKTYSNNRLASPIVQTPFFMEYDGRNPSLANWNCLQVFPRDGSPIPFSDTNKNPQIDIRVMVNKANAPDRQSVVNVSPRQYPATWISPSWYRQQDAKGVLGAPILDDKMTVNSPRQIYEIYFSRQRVVLYVDGEQRLCNDFGLGNALTMAEAAVGMGQVLYHSTAERMDFKRAYYNQTGQKYWLNNTPYVDEHTWGQYAIDEDTQLPAGFDATKCYSP